MKTFYTILKENKDRFIDKNPNLKDLDPVKIQSFKKIFNNSKFESMNDWQKNPYPSLNWFEKIYAESQKTKGANKRATKKDPTKLFEGHNIKVWGEKEGFIFAMPLDHEAAKYMRTVGNISTSWCITTDNSIFWRKYIKGKFGDYGESAFCLALGNKTKYMIQIHQPIENTEIVDLENKSSPPTIKETPFWDILKDDLQKMYDYFMKNVNYRCPECEIIEDNLGNKLAKHGFIKKDKTLNFERFNSEQEFYENLKRVLGSEIWETIFMTNNAFEENMELDEGEERNTSYIIKFTINDKVSEFKNSDLSDLIINGDWHDVEYISDEITNYIKSLDKIDADDKEINLSKTFDKESRIKYQEAIIQVINTKIKKKLLNILIFKNNILTKLDKISENDLIVKTNSYKFHGDALMFKKDHFIEQLQRSAITWNTTPIKLDLLDINIISEWNNDIYDTQTQYILNQKIDTFYQGTNSTLILMNNAEIENAYFSEKAFLAGNGIIHKALSLGSNEKASITLRSNKIKILDGDIEISVDEGYK